MKALILPEVVNDALLVTVGPFWTVLAGYLAIMNLAAFLLMWSDKRRAKKTGARRIPEKTLFLAAIFGGGIGAVAGMQLFRHKTKHWYFVWGMPVIMLAQIALLLWLIIC